MQSGTHNGNPPHPHLCCLGRMGPVLVYMRSCRLPMGHSCDCVFSAGGACGRGGCGGSGSGSGSGGVVVWGKVPRYAGVAVAELGFPSRLPLMVGFPYPRLLSRGGHRHPCLSPSTPVPPGLTPLRRLRSLWPPLPWPQRFLQPPPAATPPPSRASAPPSPSQMHRPSRRVKIAVCLCLWFAPVTFCGPREQVLWLASRRVVLVVLRTTGVHP